MNVISLTGRLDDEPRSREAATGVACEFPLVIDGRPRLLLVAYAEGHLARQCSLHLRAGRHVAVVGALRHEQWIDRSGERAERWYVSATSVAFLDRPSDLDNETVDLSAPAGDAS